MITTVDGLRHGQLIRSIQGRDRNQYYLILDMAGDRFIQAVNGVNHIKAKPKKKNLKHVKVTMLVSKKLETAILSGHTIKDSEIVAEIRQLEKALEEGDRFNG